MATVMFFRPVFPVALLISLLPGLAGWAATQKATQGSPHEIKVGLIAPMSGPVPSFGESVRNGVELAVRQWNDRGGVLGRKIVLDVADGQCSAGVRRAV